MVSLTTVIENPPQSTRNAMKNIFLVCLFFFNVIYFYCCYRGSLQVKMEA